MKRQFLENAAAELVNNSPMNKLSVKNSDRLGASMYDAPILGVARASDEMFLKLKDPAIIGEHVRLPGDWLPGANTVISLFFPLSEAVKTSNQLDFDWPSDEWLYARYEGQMFIAEVSKAFIAMIKEQGYACVAPFLDERFSQKSPCTDDPSQQNYYTSNWSERHVAHICGLGTFGLSKGLITKRGIAGRFASFITDAVLEPDSRPYETQNEYCSMCGACVKNCPVDAISLEHGKIHAICSNFLNRTLEKYNPRYGCGKCQVKVPCERAIPPRRA